MSIFVKKKLLHKLAQTLLGKIILRKNRKNITLIRMHLLKAFSLVELLVVSAIIAGITGLMVSNLDSILTNNKQHLASLFVNETIKIPLMAYKIDTGDYPSTAEGLAALLVAPPNKEKNWHGPYIEHIPKDPWDQDYNYAYPGTHNKNRYDIWSNGGGKDKKNIGNW